MQHCQVRALERYGLNLSDEDLGQITIACLTGRAKRLYLRDSFGFLKKPKGNTKAGLYRVEYKGNLIDIALKKDRMRNGYCIVTVLPKPQNPEELVIDCGTVRQLKSEGIDLC